MNTSLSTLLLLALVLVIFIVVGCGRRNETQTREPVPNNTTTNPYPHFVFAKIMDPVDPLERGSKYEDPLFDSLEKEGLGEITGGGTQMDKNKKIEWVGIDMQLADVDGALEFVRQRLKALGAPKGSVLEFKRNNEELTLPIHSD